MRPPCRTGAGNQTFWRDLLAQEISDWQDGEHYPIAMWKPIFLDAGIRNLRYDSDRQAIGEELINQVQFASIPQLCGYVKYRTKYISRRR